MPVTEVLGLVLVASAAGAINAIAGGGMLLTFPTLLFFGTPPIAANATSTLALVIGTAGSVFGYRRRLDTVEPWLRRFAPASALGGLIGGALLTWTSDNTFSKLVPFLILFATVLASLINFVAAVWFILAGLIHWPKAGVMTVGAVAGYFLGSHYSQRIPQQRVRQIITTTGFIISAATFYKEFLQ